MATQQNLWQWEEWQCKFNLFVENKINGSQLTQFAQWISDIQPILQILEYISWHLQNKTGTLKNFSRCIECVWWCRSNFTLIICARIIVSICTIDGRTSRRWTCRFWYMQLSGQRCCNDIFNGSFVFEWSFGGTCQLFGRYSGCCRLICWRWFQWFTLKITYNPSNCIRW